MIPPVKHRKTVVDGVEFDVPINVYWKEARRCWQVSVRWDKKSLTDDFYPEHYHNDLAATLAAASAWAVKKREDPTLKRDPGLRLGRAMHLDGRGPLPDGITIISRQKYNGQPEPRILQFKAYANGKCVKAIRIGDSDNYHAQRYEDAFQQVLSALQVEKEKARVLRSTPGVNAMCSMMVQIQRGFKSRERLIDYLRKA